MNCPNCRGAMTAVTLDGHLGRAVAIDLCQACQAFWFDGFESLQLEPASVLRLVRLLGERSGEKATPLSDASACPRCGARLLLVHDLQRQTRFEYRHCPERHGRLISFFNFLREKDFIRPLSPAQVDDLRRSMQTVNCSNCGAPIDLASGSTCSHCGSPLSMLDVGQAEALVSRLREAGDRSAHGIDPGLPVALARARSDVTSTFAAFEREPGWFDRASNAGLVGAALGALARWFTD
jgi:hypothetical protein